MVMMINYQKTVFILIAFLLTSCGSSGLQNYKELTYGDSGDDRGEFAMGMMDEIGLGLYTGMVGYTFPERQELGLGGYNNDEMIYLNFPKGMKNEVLFKGKYKDGLKNGKWEVFPMERPAFKGASAMKITFGWAMTLTFLDGKPIGILEKYDMEGNLLTSKDCETGDCSYYFSKKHLDDMVEEMELEAVYN
jgi:hypothetical protein